MNDLEKLASLIEAGRKARLAWRNYNEARLAAGGLYTPEQYAILTQALDNKAELFTNHIGYLVLAFSEESFGRPACVTFLDSGEIVCGNLTLKLSHDPSHLDVSGNIVDRAYAQKIYDKFIKFMETSVFMLD